MEPQSIVILDFGSQYTQLIARRIREQRVFSVVLPCTAPLDEIKGHRPAGIILSGGPCSVYDKDAPPADEAVLSLGQNQRWRRAMVDAVVAHRPSCVLDVATGTAGVALQIAHRTSAR